MRYQITLKSPHITGITLIGPAPLAGEIVLYDTLLLDRGYDLENPKLTLEVNEPGSMSFIVPPSHIYYNDIKNGTILSHINDEIYVYRNGSYFWGGYITDISFDFYNRISVNCEGFLAYLRDTIQPLARYEFNDLSTCVYDFLDEILTIHNNKITNSGCSSSSVDYISNKKIYMGTVDNAHKVIPKQASMFTRTTNYQTTYECITEKLISWFGGHVSISIDSGGFKRLYYKADYDPNVSWDTIASEDKCSKEIEFGKNLLDFNKSLDFTEPYTAVVPIGDQLQEGDFYYVPVRLFGDITQYMSLGFTTYSNVPGGSSYPAYCYPEDDIRVTLASPDAKYKEYGYKEKVIEFNDVKVKVHGTDYDYEWPSYAAYEAAPSFTGDHATLEETNYSAAYVRSLRILAKHYLENEQFNNLVLEVSAFELHDSFNFDSDEEFDISKYVLCSSYYHGMSAKPFPITKMEISLANDELPSITLNYMNYKGISDSVAKKG